LRERFDHRLLQLLGAFEKDLAFVGEVAKKRTRRQAGVNRLDAGKLVRLAIDKAPAGSALHAVAEEGVATREIAGALGRFLDVPVESIAAEQAQSRFDWLSMFFGADIPASSAHTRSLLGWEPVHPTLLEDIAAGHYPGQ
jgi:hypothetical protein